MVTSIHQAHLSSVFPLSLSIINSPFHFTMFSACFSQNLRQYEQDRRSRDRSRRRIANSQRRHHRSLPRTIDNTNERSLPRTINNANEDRNKDLSAFGEQLLSGDQCTCILDICDTGVHLKCDGCIEIEELEMMATSNTDLGDILPRPCFCSTHNANKCTSCDEFHSLLEQSGLSKIDEQDIVNGILRDEFYEEKMIDSIYQSIASKQMLKGRFWRSFIILSNKPPRVYRRHITREAINAAKGWEGSAKYAKSLAFKKELKSAWFSVYIQAMEDVMKKAFIDDAFENINKSTCSWGAINEAVLEEINCGSNSLEKKTSLSPIHERTIDTLMLLWVDREWPHFVKRVQDIVEAFFFSSESACLEDYYDHVQHSLGFDELNWRVADIVKIHQRQLYASDGLSPNDLPALLEYREINKRTEEKKKHKEEKKKHKHVSVM